MIVDVTYDLGWFRYALLLLVLLWALLAARWGGRGALLGGLLFAEVALAFWVLALARPYGLLVDPYATRLLATLSVVTASGDRETGALAGEPLQGDETLLLALAPFGERALWVPTMLPVVVMAVLGLLVYGLGPRDQRGLAAVLWLAFSTGDFDALRGLGFLPGLWSRPMGALVVTALMAVVLAVGRMPVPRALAIGIGMAVSALWALVPGPPVPLGVLEVLTVLTLDQGAWVVLGILGFVRGAPPAALAFALGGAGLLLASAAGATVDPWGGHALYRMGLLLASAGPIASALDRIEPLVNLRGGTHASSRWAFAAPPEPPHRRPPLRGARLPFLSVALMIVAVVPSSFLTRWNPKRLDPVFEASMEPVALSLQEAMAWIRNHTERDAVVMAGPTHAPAVAALGGRRTLRAPSLGTATDEERRLRLERAVIEGRRVDDLRRRYGLRYILAAPGDFRAHGLADPADLADRGLRPVYEGAGALRIYEVQ